MKYDPIIQIPIIDNSEEFRFVTEREVNFAVPGRFAVSNRGRFISFMYNKIRYVSTNKEGQVRMSLQKGPNGEYRSCHINLGRLMLLVFDYRPDHENLLIGHKNGILNDYNLDNLYWLDPYYNYSLYNPEYSRYNIKDYRERTPYDSNVIEYWTGLPDRAVMGCEKIYAISSFGKIINLRTQNPSATFLNHGGYVRTEVQNINGTRQKYSMHRLVMSTFSYFPGCEDGNKFTVDHINFNTTDNRLINLRWCNLKDNIGFAKDAGVLYDYPDDLLFKIFELAEKGLSDVEIGLIVNLAPDIVGRIRSAHSERVKNFCIEHRIAPIYRDKRYHRPLF